MKTLTCTVDKYNGIHVDGEALPADPKVFLQALLESQQHWQQQAHKLIWLSLGPDFSHLISMALAQGFSYHHCDDDHVTMIKRLQANAFVPGFATHTIGAGAVVLSDDGHILAVVEKSHFNSKPNYFKLPGGMLERGEHIADGAVREVFEETGIKTQFEGVVCFRHHHIGEFGTSNIYAVCKLKPLSFNITMDSEELCKAQWMPVSDYLSSPDISAHNKHVVAAALGEQYLTSINISGYMSNDEEYEIYSPECS